MVKRTDEHEVSAPVDVEAVVRAALGSVHDPEIPPLSIVDLGIVERIEVTPGAVHVDLLPTFAGCPALDAIREDVLSALIAAVPALTPTVRFVLSPPWTTDRISEAGHEALRTYGLTPPSGTGPVRLALGRRPDPVVRACPFCGNDDTVLESAFGPTLCRSTHFCRACRNPFEAFKPKLAGTT